MHLQLQKVRGRSLSTCVCAAVVGSAAHAGQPLGAARVWQVNLTWTTRRATASGASFQRAAQKRDRDRSTEQLPETLCVKLTCPAQCACRPTLARATCRSRGPLRRCLRRKGGTHAHTWSAGTGARGPPPAAHRPVAAGTRWLQGWMRMACKRDGPR